MAVLHELKRHLLGDSVSLSLSVSQVWSDGAAALSHSRLCGQQTGVVRQLRGGGRRPEGQTPRTGEDNKTADKRIDGMG